jgi:hypothetical protein
LGSFRQYRIQASDTLYTPNNFPDPPYIEIVHPAVNALGSHSGIGGRPMKDRVVLVAAAVLIGFGIGVSRGQAVRRCDFLVNTTPGAGPDTACLDLVALTKNGGPAIQIGNNVTRISNAGLKLCANAFTVSTGGSADIVFIYDNSGSMWSHRASIDTAAKDTSFWDATGCNGASAGTVSYAVQDTAYNRPPQSLVKTIPLLSNPPPCNERAGDPYNARGVVIRNAIRYLAQKAPTSTSGVVGFAQTTQFPQPPLQLNVVANVTQVTGMVRLDSVPTTNYAPPLTLAKTWLNDTSIIRNARQAIVFISDGNASDGAASMRLVDSTMPPIYSIFLGKQSTPDTARLKELSDTTHGLFFRVDPTKPAGIQVVMDSIIRKITETSIPKSIAITNTTNGQTSLAGPMSIGAGGNLAITLDSIIALSLGKNDFTVKVTKSDGTVGNYAFTVKADGPAEAQTTKTTQCYDPPALVMLNAQGQPDAQYSLTATSYTIKLTRSPSDVGPVIVTATTKDSMAPPTPGWGDAENVTLAAAGASGGAAVYQGPYPFNGQSAKPVPGNGTLEAAAGGQILLSWVYPRDARDFATYTLPGSKMPVTQPPSANPPGAAFTTLDPDLIVTLVPGEAGSIIHYTLDGSVPSASSAVYTFPVTVTTTTTIKAIAIKPNQINSSVMVAVFTESTAPKVATPVATPPGGTNASPYGFPVTPLAVTLSDATPGAIIHYTLDGSAPAEGSLVSVAKSSTLKAYATKAGMYPSDTLTIRFDYQAPSDVTVLFPDGSSTPGSMQVPIPTSPPNIAFIPIDRNGAALPGSANGKCGNCLAGNGKTFVGPIINLDIPGPVDYEFKIFSTLGEYLIGGTGKVEAADIPLLANAADGKRYRLRIIWTGRYGTQGKAGTGAYILKSVIRDAGNPQTAAQSPFQKKLIVFGFARQGG